MKRLCYELCAHSNYKMDPKDCPECSTCRGYDVIGDIICRLITNNLNRPLQFQTIVDHLDIAESEIRSAIWYCNGRSLILNSEWLVEKNKQHNL